MKVKLVCFIQNQSGSGMFFRNQVAKKVAKTCVSWRISAGMTGDALKVTVTKMTFMSEGRDDIELDLSGGRSRDTLSYL